MALLALLAAAPFLLTAIPPLTDVPGHIGGFTVQTARPGDGVLRWFGFHWAPTLNLASDLVVQAVHPILGVVPATWLLCLATPALTVVGIASVARALNPRGADALPWALLFVFNFPFLWGFLNFALTAALALIAFAAWIGLGGRPRWRAALFLVATPLLLIGHGVAGIVLVVCIVGYEAGERNLYRTRDWRLASWRSLAVAWPPVVAAAVTLVAWKAMTPSHGGATQWLLHRKWDSFVLALRDQDPLLDLGSMLACAVVWIAGHRAGARLRGGAAGVVIALLALFMATPSLIAGSDQIDTRLAPVALMLAFALQDWSAVAPAGRRLVLYAGFALLAVRFAVTTASFAAYDRRYRVELAALDHVAPAARVLNLARVSCGREGWRSDRLEHLGNLATTFRGAWVNAHWSIGGLQLLAVRYRPSPDYAADPSQLIWATHCVDAAIPFADRDRHMLVETMPRLPLDRVDYLWLIGERLPPGYPTPRLRRVWHSDISELYAVRR